MIGKIITWLATNLPPAIQTASDFFNNTLLPAIKAVKDFITQNLMPAIEKVNNWAGKYSGQ